MTLIVSAARGTATMDTPPSDLQLVRIQGDDLVQEPAQGQGVGKVLWERIKLGRCYEAKQ